VKSNKYVVFSIAFLIIGFMSFLFLFFKVSGEKVSLFSKNNVMIKAEFRDVGSLRRNAAVKISGVEIGRIEDISLGQNYAGFFAEVTMHLESQYKIPSNYSASIETAGILGDSYIELSESKDDILALAEIEDNSNKSKIFHNGDIIPLEKTESAINLSSLIGTFVDSKDN